MEEKLVSEEWQREIRYCMAKTIDTFSSGNQKSEHWMHVVCKVQSMAPRSQETELTTTMITANSCWTSLYVQGIVPHALAYFSEQLDETTFIIPRHREENWGHGIYSGHTIVESVGSFLLKAAIYAITLTFRSL